MDRFSQSLAIIDHLETIHPETRFLPADPRLRCEVMSMALAIACDIHPLNNLRVLDYIRTSFGQCDEAVTTSYSHWIRTGLDALERKAASISSEPFLLGNSPPALLEIFLIPRLYNARRYGVDLEPYPTLRRLDANALTLAAFADAAPEVAGLGMPKA
jgi:maleylacetoacetate isomerase